jgi:hypothetical protein
LATLPRIADWTVRVDARRHVIERVPGAES